MAEQPQQVNISELSTAKLALLLNEKYQTLMAARNDIMLLNQVLEQRDKAEAPVVSEPLQ